MRGKETAVFQVTDFMPADRPVFDPTAKSWENLRRLAKDKRYAGSIDSNSRHNRKNGEV